MLAWLISNGKKKLGSEAAMEKIPDSIIHVPPAVVANIVLKTHCADPRHKPGLDPEHSRK